MRNKGFVIVILLTAFAVGSASAEEVIHFTNGTAMPIRSHVVEGDQIKVDLGDNGFMAFPKSVVEKIENAPGVELIPSQGVNRMFPSDPSSRVYGASPRQASKQWALTPLEGEDRGDPTMSATGGVVSRQAYPNAPNSAVRKLRVNSVPQARDVSEFKPQQVAPGAPQKLPNPSIRQKKVIVQDELRPSK